MSKLSLPETEIEYRNALIDASNIGAMKALIEVGQLKPYLKQREAFRMYGEAVVKRWISEGLVNLIKDGDGNASVRIDRIQIEAVARTCNRSTYITKSEK